MNTDINFITGRIVRQQLFKNCSYSTNKDNWHCSCLDNISLASVLEFTDLVGFSFEAIF